MAFADPQSITVNAVAVSLPRTSSGTDTGAFTSADSAYKLSVGHNYGKRTRRSIRVSHQKIVSDPLWPAQNIPVSMSAYFTVDVPKSGYTATEIKQIVDALTAYLTASSGAKVTQLLGGES